VPRQYHVSGLRKGRRLAFRPASSNRAKMYSSVLYAMLTAHRQRREFFAGQRSAEGAEPRGWSPRDRDLIRIVRNLNPSDRGRFVAYNTALMLATLRTIRVVRNDCTRGFG
jgi:hypothetical protein